MSQDIEGWLSLAREVEHLFGPMAEAPGFREALGVAIEGQEAFTALLSSNGHDGSIVGGIVVSKATNSIEWLVVSESARGLGIGQRLLDSALDQLDPARPMAVQTFAPSSVEGLPARRLYLKAGFEDREPMGPNPAGVQTVLMVRPPRSRVL